MKTGSHARNGIYENGRKENKSKLDRDYSRLLADDGEVPPPNSQGSGRTRERKVEEEDENVSLERQEYLDRRRRLKELERQKLVKGKNGFCANGSDEELRAGRGRGGSMTNGKQGPSTTKEKKKLPYDLSFGSFFGPSEPVVAKRIIEEARAREEAEIVALKEAKATHEAEQKMSAENAAKKSIKKLSQSKGPRKSVDKVAEKAQKLKEARDYAFLFDESPLPDPNFTEKKISATSKPGVHGRYSGKSGRVQSNNTLLRKPLAQSENASATRASRSSRPLKHKCQPFLTSRPSSDQAACNDGSEKSAAQSRPKLSSSKSIPSKMTSAGRGTSDPGKDVDCKKYMMRKLVADSTSTNGGKSASLDRRQSASLIMGRCPAQALDSQHSDQRMDRLPAQSTDRQPVQTPNRQCAQTPDKRVAPAMDRRPVASSASNRRPALTQGSKKGTKASANVRPENGAAEPRQQILVSQTGRQNVQPKLALKGASKPATTDRNRTKYSDSQCQDATKHKRTRSSSMEFADRSAVGRNSTQLKGRARSLDDEDEDDSFIDDDDDVGNVSSLIHKLMGYNPNKYRGNDDFDDRSMEVGFRTIQAEERRSAREARLEDERELALIEAEEREERLRKVKKKLKQTGR